MGIREKLNEKQNLTIMAASLIIVLAVAFIIYSSFGGKEEPPVIADKGWYTTDDGATWFVDDVKKAPPFKTSDGKTAVRAYVFKCGDGKPFVGYLQQYSPTAKRQLEGQPQEDIEPGYGSNGGNATAIMLSGVQVKKPGDRQWVSTQSPASAAVRMTACPDGKAGVPEPVVPGTEQLD